MALTLDEFKARLWQKLATPRAIYDLITEAVGSQNTHNLGWHLEDDKVTGSISLPDLRAYLADEIGRWPGYNDGSRAYVEMSRVHSSRAWMVREALRFELGIYQRDLSDVFGAVSDPVSRFMRMTFAHPSVTDPTRWVYTPDITSGESDSQRLVTFERLMRAVPATWSFTDSTMADMARSVQAAMSSELEVHFDVAKIIEAYDEGPTSCMTAARGYWQAHETNNTHPVRVYDAPGWGIAVHRTGDRISQRCLVWVNPDDANDKRAVRVYGSGPLQRRLERNGFRFTSMSGAKLKRIVLDPQPDERGRIRILMPYLDGPNTMNVYTGVFAYHDCLVIAASQADVNAMGGLKDRWVQCSSTNGYIRIREIGEQDVTWTCALTNKTFDARVDAPALAVVGGSDPVKVSEAEAVAAGMVLAKTLHGDRWVAVYVPAATPLFDTNRVDNDHNRERCNYVRLSTEFYPDAQWAKTHEVTTVDVNGAQHLARKADCVAVIDPVIVAGAEPTVAVNVRHISQIDRKKYVRIRRVSGMDLPALRSKTITPITIVRNGKNYESIPGAHSITRVMSGEWMFGEDVASYYIFSKAFCVPREASYSMFDGHMDDLVAAARACAATVAAGYIHRDESGFCHAARAVAASGPIRMPYNRPTLTTLKESAKQYTDERFHRAIDAYFEVLESAWANKQAELAPVVDITDVTHAIMAPTHPTPEVEQTVFTLAA